jgi:hypothetical protein
MGLKYLMLAHYFWKKTMGHDGSAIGTSSKDRHNNGHIVLSNIYYDFHVLAGNTHYQ